MRSIEQSFSVSFRYPVLFTEQVFAPGNLSLKNVIHSPQGPKKVVFLVDSGVSQAHPRLIDHIIQYSQAHKDCLYLMGNPIIIPGGEVCKNDTSTVELILKAVNEYGIDRHAYMVAVGGGAVLDAVGYACSIAHRGIRIIRIPTTVLAQNDSGVGVKNGINAFGKKNFLGCFSPPAAVINDSVFLSTLHIRDWRSGIAEAVKVGLIKDKPFFQFISASVDMLNRREEQPMEELIYRCATLHIQHIAQNDPFEQGSSRPLDFGHWSAHKLEQLTGYQIRHGEAVALGMALDSTYSYLSERLARTELEQILSLLHDLGFDLYLDVLQHAELLNGLREFQEHLGGQLTVMLLDGIGKGVEVHHMDEKIIIKSVELLQNYHLNNALEV